MEKEQKKLLLVAVSVGVFLLVTITLAIVLINQRTETANANISWTPPQPVQIQPVEPVIAAPEINVNIECDDSDVTVAIDSTDQDRVIIQIPSPTTAAVPDNPQIVNVAPSTITSTVTPRTTTTSTTTAATSTTKPAQPARTATTNRTTTPSRTINDYWIQTGAFTAQVRAEDAREILAEKGLVSIIENREINGKIWYRVRLGPYTSQKEADYWLALVKSIDGFGESQVRQTTRVQ